MEGEESQSNKPEQDQQTSSEAVADIGHIGKADDSPEKARETTRSGIARFYVYGFFGVILLTFIVGLVHSFQVKDYRDMLITVSGILSGPLGFIIGYYFKASSQKE